MIPAGHELAPTRDLQGARAPGKSWLTDVLAHIREEYEEMPGLCLTLPQAQRLWGLDATTCERAIAALVEAGYLRPSTFGYVRA